MSGATSGLSSLGSGALAAGPWAIPLLGAAIASGVALNEGNSVSDILGPEGWGGQPMRAIQSAGKGDMPGMFSALGGPVGAIAEASRGGESKDILNSLFGAPARLFDWGSSGGDTMDLIRVFANPMG